MAIIGSAAFGWTGSNTPRHMLDDVKQVGVTKDSYIALKTDGSLHRWTADVREAAEVMTGVSSFACGQTGVFAIDTKHALWHVDTNKARHQISNNVIAASIGDGADYYVLTDGSLYVKGKAHRGQYGNGRLLSTAAFVKTADEAVDVKAHTGHAIYLTRSGEVFGTGGNVYGPLSTHGLGDKATRWGKIFDAARAVATGASHSLAIRQDDSLWIWGSGFGTVPRKILDNVTTAAAGNGDTIALTADGALWQWEAGNNPRRLQLGSP
jgi:hypothetical protein